MAPNKGFSSNWILHALHRNDENSKLHYFDIHDASVKNLDDRFRSHWVFTKGDYIELYGKGNLDMEKFDFLSIDAIHKNQFSCGYCQHLLSKHKVKAIVAIHDIVAEKRGGGRESE